MQCWSEPKIYSLSLFSFEQQLLNHSVFRKRSLWCKESSQSVGLLRLFFFFKSVNRKKKSQLKTGADLSSVSKCYNPSTNLSSVSPVVSPTMFMSLLSPPRFGVFSCGSMALCSGVPICPWSMEADMGPRLG